MRILIQNNQFYPREGGIVTHVHNIAKELANRGNKVSVLCKNFNNLQKKEELFENLLIEIAKIGKERKSCPFLSRIQPFKHFLNKNIENKTYLNYWQVSFVYI